MRSFTRTLVEKDCVPDRAVTTTLQVNVGKLCNQTCRHCHVDAGPHKKRENMSSATVERIIELMTLTPSLKTIDITGGAPELNPSFRHLVQESRKLGLEVIDRCNLTVLFVKGQEDTAKFLADQNVHVVASLPCYTSNNVDLQRGDGVFVESIRALQTLNSLGYGRDKGLQLDLVYNPIGPTLPPAADQLEASYKKKLKTDFDIDFNQLYTITNMPIKRFLVDLKRQKSLDTYMDLLCENFNVAAVSKIMCRSHLSVSWDGKIYDCDFNQMLDMPVECLSTIDSIQSFNDLAKTQIRFADHCFGCTAGAGSSCTGSLVATHA